MKNWQKFLIAIAVLSLVFWLADDYETVVGGIFQAIWAILAGFGVYRILETLEHLVEDIKDKTFAKKHGNMIKVDDQRFSSITDAKIYIRVKYEGWNDDRIK